MRKCESIFGVLSLSCICLTMACGKTTDPINESSATDKKQERVDFTSENVSSKNQKTDDNRNDKSDEKYLGKNVHENGSCEDQMIDSVLAHIGDEGPSLQREISQAVFMQLPAKLAYDRYSRLKSDFSPGTQNIISIISGKQGASVNTFELFAEKFENIQKLIGVKEAYKSVSDFTSVYFSYFASSKDIETWKACQMAPSDAPRFSAMLKRLDSKKVYMIASLNSGIFAPDFPQADVIFSASSNTDKSRMRLGQGSKTVEMSWEESQIKGEIVLAGSNVAIKYEGVIPPVGKELSTLRCHIQNNLMAADGKLSADQLAKLEGSNAVFLDSQKGLRITSCESWIAQSQR